MYRQEEKNYYCAGNQKTRFSAFFESRDHNRYTSNLIVVVLFLSFYHYFQVIHPVSILFMFYHPHIDERCLYHQRERLYLIIGTFLAALSIVLKVNSLLTGEPLIIRLQSLYRTSFSYLLKSSFFQHHQ